MHNLAEWMRWHYWELLLLNQCDQPNFTLIKVFYFYLKIIKQTCGILDGLPYLLFITKKPYAMIFM